MGNYRDEFDEFLKGKADQHKLYPSDKVWNAINRKLHPRRKWYLAGILLLITGIGYYTAQEIQSTEPASSNPENQSLNSSGIVNDISEPATSNAQHNIENQIIARNSNSNVLSAAPAPAAMVNPLTENSITAELLKSQSKAKVIPLFPHSFRDNHVIAPTEISINAAEQLADNPIQISSLTSLSPIDEESLDRQRSEVMASQALYAFEYKKSSRFSIQYSFSPYVSYRMFSGRDDAKLNTSINTVPNALNIPGKADNLVNHIPAPGIELGTSVLYHVTPRLAVKSGIQFNYSRYDINAYSTSGEIATIALRNNSGMSTRSVYGYSTHSNFGGNHTEVLENAYFQVSVPIGLELTVLGNERVQLGVAGSMQPSYLINKNSYLISTDYKNYTQNPTLLNSWNLYSNAEIFAAFQTPTVRWQIGPQVRYQVTSGFKKEYPIKQNLIEYGIKIGVSRPVFKK